jgi:hypothetical protein
VKGRTTMARKVAMQPRFKPQPVARACKKHPGVAAVRDGLCKNCLFYADHGKAQAKRAEESRRK